MVTRRRVMRLFGCRIAFLQATCRRAIAPDRHPFQGQRFTDYEDGHHGPERIVTGDDGSAYCTSDRCVSFTQFCFGG